LVSSEKNSASGALRSCQCNHARGGGSREIRSIRVLPERRSNGNRGQGLGETLPSVMGRRNAQIRDQVRELSYAQDVPASGEQAGGLASNERDKRFGNPVSRCLAATTDPAHCTPSGSRARPTG